VIPNECKDALREEKPSHIFALFSGGHDSLCSTHIASQLPGFSGVVHCNTGIGIEKTREFVRDTCEWFGWPLLEKHPDRFTYEDLLLGANDYYGFPGGPKSHMRFYYYLKQRAIDAVVRDHKTGPKDRIGLVTGIRKAESERRTLGNFSEPAFREGAKLWLNPILNWTEADKNAYMESYDLPRNEVVDVLHRSGECLCGAFTAKGELRMIEIFYPEAAARIRQLETKVQAEGKCGDRDEFRGPLSDVQSGCYWGRREREGNPDQLDFLPMCVGCEREAA
jgi:3'-phosphoadenosine 5'-phosphosulfate sulfotransferase (PAPS reductase)/FAD synthetase